MLTRVHQLFAAKEASEGTYLTDATLLVIANAILAIDPELTPDYTEHERNEVGDSASRVASDFGRRGWDWTMKLDFAANGVVSGTDIKEPGWATLLRSCGMRHFRLRKVATGGAITGTFTHFETITGGSSGATGRIVGSPVGSPTYIVYYLTSTNEFTTAEVLTGADSGATVTVNVTPALDDHGHFYPPTSWIIHKAARGVWTGTPLVGELLKGGTSGAFGTLIDPLADLVATGDLYFEPVLGTFVSGETLTGQDTGANCALTGAPSSEDNYTLSIGSILGGGMHIGGRGVRGNWKTELVSGAPAYIDFELKALQQIIQDKAEVASYAPTVPTQKLRFQSASFSVDAAVLLVSSFGLDMQNNVSIREAASAAEGALSARVGGRDPTGSMDPEMLAPAAHDFYARWAASTLASVKVRMGVTEALIGAASGYTPGSGVWIDVPKAQYTAVPFGDREDVRIGDTTFMPRRDTVAGDDEIRLFVV